MPSKKKKFIDKKKAVVYRLVHRSQKDPLQADEEAPEHVLVQVPKSSKVDIQLPQSVFPSSSEERVGLLHKSLEVKDSQLDLDPDVVAGLEDDFDFNNEENQLEDDFIALANHPNENITEGKIEVRTAIGEENISECDFITCTDDIPESKYTKCSSTSAVTSFKNEVQSLNERFEKIFSYDDDDDDEDIESLENDELDGYLTTDNQFLNDLAENFREGNKMFYLSDMPQTMEGVEENKNKIKLMNENEKLIKITYDVPSKYNSFDCESILTAQSNLYNHPKIIKDTAESTPVKFTKNGEIQTNLLMPKGLKKHQLKQLDREMKLVACEEREICSDEGSNLSHSTKTACFVRSRNETPEERKARKMAIKEIRRENRMVKKATKVAFKIEEMHKHAVALNVQQNLMGIKL